VFCDVHVLLSVDIFPRIHYLRSISEAGNVSIIVLKRYKDKKNKKSFLVVL